MEVQRNPQTDKKLDIIKDADGNHIVRINDLLFQGRRNVNWDTVETHLKKYIGECLEITETSDLVSIGTDFPDEFAHSKDTKTLRGANLYAKANVAGAVRGLVEIATNKTFSENYARKHNSDAKFGWYRYDTRFAIPVHDDDGKRISYNVFGARVLVRRAQDGKLYLYDILRIKKETSKPLER